MNTGKTIFFSSNGILPLLIPTNASNVIPRADYQKARKFFMYGSIFKHGLLAAELALVCSEIRCYRNCHCDPLPNPWR